MGTRRFQLVGFGVGFPAHAPDSLGQGIEVDLVLLAEAARNGEHWPVQMWKDLLIGGNRGQFLSENRVEDGDVGGLFAVGLRPVPLAAAAADDDRRDRKEKDSGATEAAPLSAEAFTLLQAHRRARSICGVCTAFAAKD